MKLDLFYEEILPHPVERVWAALTSADALRQWLMESDFEPEIGRPFTFRCPPGPGIRGFVECSVVELVPPRRVVWSWLATDLGRPTRVTFELEPVARGTRLTLRHEGEVTPDVGERTRAGWEAKIRELVGYLAGAPR